MGKKLIILDVNGVLLFSRRANQNTNNDGGFIVGYKTIFQRPHLQEFLMFCKKTFRVGLWSCMSEKNLLNLVDKVFSSEEVDGLNSYTVKF